MSIELTNGVILPDLPSAVDCIQYPYAIVYHYDAVRSEAPSGYLRYYAIVYSTKPFYVLKGGLLSSGPDVNTLLLNYPDNITYMYATDPLFGSPYVDWQVSNSAEEYFAVDIEQDYSYGPSITSLVAANHDVYYVTEYDEATNEVITAQEVYKPRNYYFYKLTAGVNIPRKFLGVEGTQQLIANVKSYIDNAVGNLDLPSGGTGESELFIVNVELNNGSGTSSHSSVEINEAFVNGKVPVIALPDGAFMTIANCSADKVEFMVTVLMSVNGGTGGVMSVIYTIDANKNVSMEITAANTVPDGGTVGQVLTKNDQGGNEWKTLDLPSDEPERFIVTMTQEGTGPVTASHSSTEICDAIENGKIPIAMFDGGGMMAPVTMYDSAGVTFSLTMLDVEDEGGPVAVTVTYTVDANKNVTVEMQVGEFLPRTGTAGQILVKNDQNISQWVNADTIKGAKGDKGDTGDQGPVGPAGADGKDGYTPVRGTDYWTEADKAEIKSYVDEAILGGAW